MPISGKISTWMEQSSWIRRMFEEGNRLRAELGTDNVFDLSLGNPVVEPPPELAHALAELVRAPGAGHHRYMPNAGYRETRAAVARALSRASGHGFDPDQVVMTVGAGGGLNVVLKTILDPGDEVVLVRPYFPEYVFYVDNHGGTTVLADCRPRDFGLDLGAIRAALTPRTRALILNSPNNPAGNVYAAADVDALGELLRAHARATGRVIYLVGDEPYRKLVYDGARVPWIFGAYDQSVLVTSHSKDLALPGERIGYIAVGPRCVGIPTIVAGLTFATRTLGFVNAPALMQRLVAGLQDVTIDLEGYRQKRDALVQALVTHGYDVVPPAGAFYMFPRALGDDDVAFVRALVRHRVLAVPGSGFGMPGYFRLSYAVDDRTIDGAIRGLAAVADEYRA